MGGEFLDASVVPLRDADGNMSLHYVLRQQRPEDFALGQAKDGRYYYSIEVTAQVLTPDDKLVFKQERKHSEYVDAVQFEKIKHESLAYEGTLPITPGKYKLEFVLSNTLNQTAFRVQKQVEVPPPSDRGIKLSLLVAFDESEMLAPHMSATAPFTLAGVKFTPLVGSQLDLGPGRDLKVFYQIWAPPADPAAYAGKNLLVEYGYGRPGLRGDSKVIHDKVARSQFNRVGSLVSGKKIPLADAPAGNYMLVVTITDPETQQKSYASLNFRILANAPPSDTWYVADSDTERGKGAEEYHRALCYMASGDRDSAALWLRKALEKNRSNEQALGTLVDLYFRKQSYAEVAALYPQVSINSDTNERIILEIAESLDKGEDVKKAAQMLETAVQIKASATLYLKLASYYRRMGYADKAVELERKSQSLPSAPPSTTPPS